MEYSFESIMAVGTGMVSRENVEEQDNTTVNYDGYADGLDMDITRTSEQLHFMDTYNKLQSLHSSEKLRMIKKINTAYNGKTIGNINVANSVESFCNNAMSTEGVFKHIIGYTFSTKFNKNIVGIGSNNSGFIYNTIKKCFDQQIYKSNNEYCTVFDYLGISPIIIKRNKSELIINKKYSSALKQKLSIYKIDANIDNNPGGRDDGVIGKITHRIGYNKEGIQIGQVNKILETQTKTIYEWLNEFYTVKIVESNNSESQIRKNILKMVSTNLLPWLSQYIKKNNVKGFDIYKTIDNKELKMFSDSDTNKLILCQYYAWKFTDGRARDSEKYEIFDNFLTKFETDVQNFINTQLKIPLKFTFDGGDWDDGYGCVIYKDNK